MTELSRFWEGTTVGDATDAPYDASTKLSRVLLALSGSAGRLTNKGGVWHDDLNGLSVTSPGANTQRIASGRGCVQGTWYENNATVDVTIPTPSVSTRIDRIVLRKSWALQTVRVTRIAGAEGGGAPALTQTDGVTWDVPLHQVSITTGAVMTVTDQRQFINNAPFVVYDESVTGLSTTGVISVPSGYSNLRIEGYGESDRASVSNNSIVRAKLNGDAGNNYHNQSVYGAGSSPTATEALNDSSAMLGHAPGALAVANYAGQFAATFLQYSNATRFKTFTSEVCLPEVATTGGLISALYAGHWRSAAAIANVEVFLDAGNWVAGSRIRVIVEP